MSSTVTRRRSPLAHGLSPLDGPPGVPFGRTLHAELRKLVDTRAGLWMLIAIMSSTVLFMAPTVMNLPLSDLRFVDLTVMATMPQMLLLPVIGILAATGEWSQRTGLVTFVLEPRRGRVVLAKLLAALALGLASFAAAVATGAAANAAGIVLRHGDGSWALDWVMLGSFSLMQVLLVAQGVGFGLVLQSTPAAIAAYYLLPTVWSVAASAVVWLQTAPAWLDMTQAVAPLLSDGMTSGAWVDLGISSTLWVVVPLLVGSWRVSRREIA